MCTSCKRLLPLATTGDGNCLLHAASLGKLRGEKPVEIGDGDAGGGLGVTAYGARRPPLGERRPKELRQDAGARRAWGVAGGVGSAQPVDARTRPPLYRKTKASLDRRPTAAPG